MSSPDANSPAIPGPEIVADRVMDASGLLCPLPVLRARKALQSMEAGQTLLLIATDPAAVIDLPHFCAETSHILLSVTERDGCRHFLLRKGG